MSFISEYIGKYIDRSRSWRREPETSLHVLSQTKELSDYVWSFLKVIQASALTVAKQQFEYHAFVLQLSISIYCTRAGGVLIFMILLDTRGLGSFFLERSGTCLHLLFLFQQHKLDLCWKTSKILILESQNNNSSFLFWNYRGKSAIPEWIAIIWQNCIF